MTSQLIMTPFHVSNSAETTLVQRAKRGDLDAFNALVRRHQKHIYNIAYRIMGNDLAADMTQEAFLKAYQSIHKLKGDNFKAWVARIVSNHCLDELRRRKRQPTASIEEITEEYESPPFLRDEGDEPEEVQKRKERIALIEACIGRLPPEQRTLVLLRDLYGYNYKEISQTTNTSIGTVKSRLSRTREKLRQCLSQTEL